MFDVVVGGGGAAGCVVAARVAEARSHSVLLLEAGPDRRADTPPELRNGWTIEPEPFDWGQLQSLHDRPHPTDGTGGEMRAGGVADVSVGTVSL